MGGGKTHSMIALALLTKDKKSRYEQLGDMYDDIENIKVIAFSGRESDAKYGIWGELVNQLDKFEYFKELYLPLRTLSESSCINLLKNEKVLTLLGNKAGPFNSRDESVKKENRSETIHILSEFAKNLVQKNIFCVFQAY